MAERTRNLLATVMPALFLGLAIGCSMPSNPWRFAEPPARGATVRPTVGDHQQIVVIGRFDDPSRAPNYSHGVGRAMSDAFSRALLRTGNFEVRINERLAAEARRYARFEAPGSVAADLTAEQRQARDRLGRDRDDVDYVIIGKVTDFYHTRDLPDEASRWGVIGRRNEAVVSFDLRIVDMNSMQVVGADHLMGSTDAGRARSHELYENIALDSYLFWNTPLGRAGRQAIERAVNRAVAMMPADRTGDAMMYASGDTHRDDSPITPSGADEESAPVSMAVQDEQRQRTPGWTASQRFSRTRPQILRVEDSRRLTIMGGRNIGVMRGDRFHIRRDAATGSDVIVNDPVTGRPLRIAVIEVAETTSTGWLLGQKPRQLDLRGMMLELERAEFETASAHAEPTADSGP